MDLVDAVSHEGDILAYVVRREAAPQKTTFVTPGTEQLQLGFIVYPKGSTIQRHEHLPVQRTVHSTPEAVMVRSGRCRLELYDANHTQVANRTLGAGDLVLLLRGGHGFVVEEDCVLLEVKQGPHLDGEKLRF